MATVDTETERNGECEESERHGSDLYIRTGWADANTAFEQLEKGKAKGDRVPLWLRSLLQHHLHVLGNFVDSHAGKVLFVSLLVVSTFCVGLKNTTFHSSIDQLWKVDTGVTDNENILGINNPTSTSSSPAAHSQSTIDMLSTHQMIIQTPADPDAGILHPRALLEHLELVKKATQVTVKAFDQTWRLKHICQSPSIPAFDTHYIEQMFENMMPCSIITPVDCFWEGSKLLGPEYPVVIPGIGDKVKWTNLNPSRLVADMKKIEFHFDYHTLENYLRRAGITTGYQEKPCLNPKDPECPETAPNYNSSQTPDIGAELTSGCYGFAAKYMHWPEDLLVGGTVKNKTGHIRQAKALQSVVQLMDAHEMYEFWSNHWKVHHFGWSQEKASFILDLWQKRFAEEIQYLTTKNISSPSYNFNAFSTATLNDILKQHSHFNFITLGIVLMIILLFSWIVDSGLAALSTLLLVGSTAAGLGLCSVLGFPINVLSVHVLPYLSVGLALRDVYLLLNTYRRCQNTGEAIKRSGLNVLFSAIHNAAAFLSAAIVPISALRIFSLQCAILVVFNTAALLIVMPALMALEMRFKRAPLFRFREVAQKHAQAAVENDHNKNLLQTDLTCQKCQTHISSSISYYLTLIILNPMIRVMLFISYACIIIFFIFNSLKLEYDMNLSMFLPRNTQEYNFIESQNKYFGFYSFYLATTEFEYPLNQKLLYEYHSSLTKVPNVLKDSNGGLNMNDFWLANFRDFLRDLQEEFDINLATNCLNGERWYPNATEKAVLAFKLLSQTGDVEFPVDKRMILKKRLVIDGIIDPNAFYNYLSVWSSNDLLSYSSSKSNLTPKPLSYDGSKTDFDLKIPKSKPLTYTQMPFYLKNLRSTSKIVNTLKEIHLISDTYKTKGLKNYPLGLIFAYYDQFLKLDFLLLAQVIVIFITTLVLSCVLLRWTKIWYKAFNIAVGILVLAIVNISSMTAVFVALYWIIVGRNVCLVLTGFVSAIGNKDRRTKLSIELYYSAMLKGDLALLMCITVWITSDFDFMRNHFFYVTTAIILTSFANSFVFFPIVLSLFGPTAEVVPLEYTDRISTPPPVVTPVVARQQYAKAPRRSAPSSIKAVREPSLTTITEESCNQSIVVQPEVVVEYSNPNDSGSSSSGQYTTKVTATTNIKVEVVSPMYRERSSNKNRDRERDDRPCHRVVPCGAEKRKPPKCKDDFPSKRECCSSRRCSDRGSTRDDCQMHHRDACRHTCWDQERRHFCSADQRSTRTRHNSNDNNSYSSDSETEKCWTESVITKKTKKHGGMNDESSSTSSSSTTSCTKIHDHDDYS